MSTIAIIPYPESGHLNGTFGLARQLRARGHEIVYLPIHDFVEQVHAEGFAASPILERDYPRGTLARQQDELYQLRGVSQLLRIRANSGRLFAAIARSTLDAMLRAAGADLVLFDRELPAAGLLGHRAGLPICALSTTLSVGPDDDGPPLTTDVAPGSAYRARSAWAWRKIAMRRRLLDHGVRLAGIAPWLPQYLALADHCGFPRDRVLPHRGWRPALAVPQLVICPAAFDLPAVRACVERDAMRAYAAPFVDLARREPAPPVLTPAGPLVLCSLGSQPHRLATCRDLFRALVAAARLRPHVHFVLAIGRHLRPAELGELPPNASVHATVPQLALLARASLFVTHAGLNSVKEAIVSGVPMLAFPLGFDQPGNAVRIEHHGLGLRGDVRRTSPLVLGRMIDRVLHGRAFATAVRSMREIFLAADRRGAGLDFVEQLLQRHSSGASARQSASARSSVNA